jgi:hypothetical protein
MNALKLWVGDMVCVPYEGYVSDEPKPSKSRWEWQDLTAKNSLKGEASVESISPSSDTCDLSALWLEMQEKWTLYGTTSYRDVSVAHGLSLHDHEITVTSTFIANYELEAQFNKLAQRWKKETLAQSSVASITMHPAYLDIIGMGREALPLILRDLQKETSHWFIALRAISKTSPVKPEEAGNLKKMRAAWLKWGKENGFLE